jgi:hypothetical protein
MKRTTTTYTCDNCGKEVVLNNGNFPFDRGWFRLDGIVLKIPSETTKVIEESNLDFCQARCMFDNISRKMAISGVKYEQKEFSEESNDDFRVDTRMVDEAERILDDMDEPKSNLNYQRRRFA